MKTEKKKEHNNHQMCCLVWHTMRYVTCEMCILFTPYSDCYCFDGRKFRIPKSIRLDPCFWFLHFIYCSAFFWVCVSISLPDIFIAWYLIENPDLVKSPFVPQFYQLFCFVCSFVYLHPHNDQFDRKRMQSDRAYLDRSNFIPLNCRFNSAWMTHSKRQYHISYLPCRLARETTN